jgi:hypothetical protein
MDFSLFSRIKNKKSRKVDFALYCALALLLVTVFSGAIFDIKMYFQNQQVAELDSMLSHYGTPQQKESERKVLAYKHQIDDFAQILNSHKISLNVFSFLSQETLPNVWFSSVDVLEEKNQANLMGEAASMAVLADQVNLIEKNPYIEHLDVLSTQAGKDGRVQFTLSVSLSPDIFTDDALAAPTAQINATSHANQ